MGSKKPRYRCCFCLFLSEMRKYSCSEAAQLGNKVWCWRPQLGLAMLAAAAASLSSRSDCVTKTPGLARTSLPAPTNFITKIALNNCTKFFNIVKLGITFALILHNIAKKNIKHCIVRVKLYLTLCNTFTHKTPFY